ARAANFSNVVTPLQEIWDREFRNAIFHSDYSVHGGEVRFRKNGLPVKYDHDKVVTLVNRALAYFDALKFLRSLCIKSYTQPKAIPMHPENAAFPNEQAIVMVREGHGAIGLKSAWNLEQLQSGHIPWHFGHFSQEEMKLAGADPMRAFFPAKDVGSN